MGPQYEAPIVLQARPIFSISSQPLPVIILVLPCWTSLPCSHLPVDLGRQLGEAGSPARGGRVYHPGPPSGRDSQIPSRTCPTWTRTGSNTQKPYEPGSCAATSAQSTARLPVDDDDHDDAQHCSEIFISYVGDQPPLAEAVLCDGGLLFASMSLHLFQHALAVRPGRWADTCSQKGLSMELRASLVPEQSPSSVAHSSWTQKNFRFLGGVAVVSVLTGAFRFFVGAGLWPGLGGAGT
jgi:hypothetical protein